MTTFSERRLRDVESLHVDLGCFCRSDGICRRRKFVSAYLIPSPQHQNSAKIESKIADQKTPEKVDDHNAKTEPLWVPTDSVGLYTLVLAVFTGLLVFVSIGQGYFLLRADKTARIAANAANLSAKAAIGQKLPILRCITPHLWPAPSALYSGGYAGTGDPTKHNFIKILWLELFNHGETLAYPQEYGLGWMLTDKEPTKQEALPPDPIYTDIHLVSRELVIKDKFQTRRIETFCFAPSEEIKTKISTSAAVLRLCAYVKYVDFLDQTHEARFCWRYNLDSRNRSDAGLYRDDNVPESYTRKT